MRQSGINAVRRAAPRSRNAPLHQQPPVYANAVYIALLLAPVHASYQRRSPYLRAWYLRSHFVVLNHSASIVSVVDVSVSCSRPKDYLLTRSKHMTASLQSYYL